MEQESQHMKSFLKNLAIISVVVATFLFLTFRSIETVWEPIEKTGGEGTQAVGESDLVLPGGGEDMATAQDPTVYSAIPDSGMTETEKLELIDAMLTDAFAYFGDLEDTQAWEILAVCINSVLNFGGVADG